MLFSVFSFTLNVVITFFFFRRIFSHKNENARYEKIRPYIYFYLIINNIIIIIIIIIIIMVY